MSLVETLAQPSFRPATNYLLTLNTVVADLNLRHLSNNKAVQQAAEGAQE